MRYAIQVSSNTKHEQWMYLALEGVHKIFVFEDDITDKTKLFDTAAEAGEYVDKHFNNKLPRCSYSKVRIVVVD